MQLNILHVYIDHAHAPERNVVTICYRTVVLCMYSYNPFYILEHIPFPEDLRIV